MSSLVKNPSPLIQEFFGGKRGRAAEEGYKHES